MSLSKEVVLSEVYATDGMLHALSEWHVLVHETEPERSDASDDGDE